MKKKALYLLCLIIILVFLDVLGVVKKKAIQIATK